MKKIFKLLTLAGLACFAAAACVPEEPVIPTLTPPTLAVSPSSVVVTEDSQDIALTFSWNDVSADGVTPVYGFQITKKGDSEFASGTAYECTGTEKKFSHAELAALAGEIGASLNDGFSLIARLRVTAKESGIEPVLSNVVEATVSKEQYKINNLYPIGNGTPYGWSQDKTVAMDKSGSTFTWTGHLYANAEFKFLLQNDGNWWPGVVNKTDDPYKYEPVIGFSDSEDKKFKVDKEGKYTITIDAANTNALKMKVEFIDDDIQKLEVEHLYILGDATKTGWSLDDMEEFAKNGNTFTWEGSLTEGGEFRFPMQRDWWPCLMIAQDGVTLVKGVSDDEKTGYTVDETAIYKIICDIDNMKVSITKTGDIAPEEKEALFLNEFDTKNKQIEIYNAEDKEVDMTGWVILKNDGEEGEKDTFVIPAALAKVPAKGYAVFTCKQTDAANGPLFGLSGTKGFKIALKKGDTVIDEVDNLTTIVAIEDGKSWGRETDGAANFVIFDTPTIGAANGAAAPAENFDYTPSAAYSAANNLWKPVDEAEAAKFFMYMNIAPDWSNALYDNVSTTDCPYCELKQSTYRLSLMDQTYDRWQNQFYIFPGDESKFIPLDPAKKYKFSVTLQSTKEFGAFFKLAKYDPNNNAQGKYEGAPIWEAPGYPVNINFEADKPIVMESEFEGFEAPNINLIFDFGGNPAGTVVYIKDITLVEVPELSISDIIKVEKGTQVISKECQVMALTQRGFVASDGEKAIYVYTKGSDFDGKVGLGDKVKFAGSKTIYNGVPEVEKVSALEKLSINNSITYPQSTDVTADALTYKATEAEYISFTGTLAISGTYYNVELEGIDKDKKMGSLVFPADYLKAQNYDGKKIKVTGYYNGLSGSDKYLNVIATSIDNPDVAPAVAITIDGDMSDWANVEGTVMTPTGEEGVEGAQAIAEVKGFVDDTNVYVYVKRVKLGRWTKLWGGDDGNAGYYYYDFDMDNNPSTGDYAENSHGNYECWTYLYIFGGTADAPVFRATPPGSAKGMKIDNVNCNGVVTADAIETEISFPLADLATITSDTISVTVWGNKDGNPLVKAYIPVK